MQTFYNNLTAAVDGRDSSPHWLANIRNASLEQIGVLQESVLAWVLWG